MVLALPFSNVEKTHIKHPKDYVAEPVTMGQKLLKRRVDLKLMQKEAAKILGVTSSQLCSWEKDRCIPDEVNMRKIMEFIAS